VARKAEPMGADFSLARLGLPWVGCRCRLVVFRGQEFRCAGPTGGAAERSKPQGGPAQRRREGLPMVSFRFSCRLFPGWCLLGPIAFPRSFVSQALVLLPMVVVGKRGRHRKGLGVDRFSYLDQSVTCRFFDSEAFNDGLVDVSDSPDHELVEECTKSIGVSTRCSP